MIDIIRETNARDKGVIFQFDKIKDIPNFVLEDMIVAKGAKLYRATTDIAEPIVNNDPDNDDVHGGDWEIITDGMRPEYVGSKNIFRGLPRHRLDGSELRHGDYCFMTDDVYVGGVNQGYPKYRAGVYRWNQDTHKWEFYYDFFREVNNNQFLKDSDVNPAIPGSPTLDEIKNVTKNYKFTNFVAYYTGTDDSNDDVTRAYWIDKYGSVMVLYSSDGGLLKTPVADLTELKAISSPKNGEMRQIISELPKVVHYVFDTNATQGIDADDGTAGKWVKVVGGLRKAPVADITELKALPTPEDNELRFVKGETYYYEFVKSSTPLDTFFDGISEASDDSSGYWIKRQSPFRQDVFDNVVGAVKDGILLTPQDVGLKLTTTSGKLVIYNNDKHGYEEYPIVQSDPITFQYIDDTGAPVDGTDLQDLDTTQYENNGTLTTLNRNSRASFQKIYIDKDGKYWVRRGTKQYATMNAAKRDYAFEQVDQIDGLYYLGGVIIRKDATDIKSNKAELVFASKFLEPILTSNSSDEMLYTEPVTDLTALKAVELPLDGETKQVLDTLPLVTLYTFNKDATRGIAADDGTPGFWNKVISGLRKEPVVDLTELKAIEAPQDNEIRRVGDTHHYYFVKGKASTDLPNETCEDADDGTGVWVLLNFGTKALLHDKTDFTAEEDITYVVNTETGTETVVTLPTAVKSKRVKVINNGSGTIKVVPSNSGNIDGDTYVHINGEHSAYTYLSLSNDEWTIESNYLSKKTVRTFDAKDTDGNIIQFVELKDFVECPIMEGEVMFQLDLPPDRRIKNLQSGNGWRIVDKYTGVILIEPGMADSHATFELMDVQYDYGSVGRIVFQIANPEMGIYPIDGTDISDKMLYRYLQKFNIDGFTLDNNQVTIHTPDWRGRTLAGIGKFGINSSGQMITQSIQRHSHHYTHSTNYKANGNPGSGNYPIAHYQSVGATTANAGSDYTRPHTVGMQLCIVGTTLIKLDDESKVATPFLININNGTVNGGDSVASGYEGVTPSRFVVDMPSGKMLDSANMNNANVNVVDAYGGVFYVQQIIGGGDIAVNLVFKDKPTPEYLNRLDPESVGGNWYLARSSFFNGDNSYNRFILNYGGSKYKPVWSMDDGDGIGGKSVFIRKNEIHYISGGGFDINRKSFCFAFWAKVIDNDNNDKEVYLLGNNQQSTAKKTLHIGWRTDDTFTVAFWSADINITVPNEFKFSNVKNQWIHIGVVHNKNSKKSIVYINGNNIGSGTHADNYQSTFNAVFAANQTSRSAGKISQLRFAINVDDAMVTDAKMKNIYDSELPFLKEIK